MEKILDFVEEHGLLMNVKKGELIYQFDEKINSFYFIKQGLVKIATDSLEGRATTITMNSSNEFFGYIDYLKGQKEYTKYAVALTNTLLYSIPIELIHKPCVRESYILDSMVQELVKAQELNIVLSTMTVPERLRWLLTKTAMGKGGYLVIDMPLTHEEMANYLGCSRQKVSSFISKWKKEGALISEGGTFKILDEDKLQ